MILLSQSVFQLGKYGKKKVGEIYITSEKWD